MKTELTTRRLFLQKGLTLVAASATIPTFLDQTVWAVANPEDGHRVRQPSGADGKILVVVQLSGGNDGLNTVIPYADDAYHRARPTLGHEAGAVLKINDSIGLHPNLGPVADLIQKGKAAAVQGVGYPNPNRSHFRSMDIWQSARPDQAIETSGWLGRYFDNTCHGEDPQVGIAMGEQLPLAMMGEKVMPLAFERPEAFRYNGPDRARFLKLNAPPAKPASHATQDGRTPAGELDFLHRTAMDAQLASERILRITERFRSTQQYPPGEFGQGLRNVSAMIRGGLPTRVYYVSLGGFDTHANERARHDQLMRQFAMGMQAFWRDMEEQKNDDRVLMMTFSEFGRRVAQNASGGTDHGTAAPMFLFGSSVNAGLIGKYPSLTDLDQGDLKYTTDFRSVYASVLQNWLDAPTEAVLGRKFQTLPIIKV
ncbi:MAG TPA: DUF1501 domain-containing protein [Tepidisphaeraceae bacterium]|jgi:uncharacterized protein (DUF1501 family)